MSDPDRYDRRKDYSVNGHSVSEYDLGYDYEVLITGPDCIGKDGHPVIVSHIRSVIERDYKVVSITNGPRGYIAVLRMRGNPHD